MKLNKILGSMLVALIAISIMSCSPTGSSITLNKTVFNQGDEVTIKYSAKEELGDHAWIGIIPSDIPHGDEAENDRHDIAYKYFTEKEGEMIYTIDFEPGKYDFRMHTSDTDGKEIASISFEVK